MTIKNFALKQYLSSWLYNVGFARGSDVKETLMRAMRNTQSLREWGLIGPLKDACDADYDEGFALKFLQDELIAEQQAVAAYEAESEDCLDDLSLSDEEIGEIERRLHDSSKPSAADIALVADQRAEYLSANWPGLSC